MSASSAASRSRCSASAARRRARVASSLAITALTTYTPSAAQLRPSASVSVWTRREEEEVEREHGGDRRADAVAHAVEDGHDDHRRRVDDAEAQRRRDRTQRVDDAGRGCEQDDRPDERGCRAEVRAKPHGATVAPSDARDDDREQEQREADVAITVSPATTLKIRPFRYLPITSGLADRRQTKNSVIGSSMPFTACTPTSRLNTGMPGIIATIAPITTRAVTTPTNTGASRGEREMPRSKPNVSEIT